MSAPISRAHRRFLGLTLPPNAIPQRPEFQPLEQVSFTPTTRKMIREHLSTAGGLRSGILIGYRDDVTVLVRAILPNGYGQPDPLRPHPQYLLGAVDALQQVSDQPLEWVGSWMMPADGLVPPPAWNERVWHLARRHALVSPETVLVTFGQSLERLDIQAWSEDNAEPLPLKVVLERSAGESL